MQSFLTQITNVTPRLRRVMIMAMDIAVVLGAIPLSLLLSNSSPSFDLYSPSGVGLWLSLGLAAHLLFRVSGLYSMMWRFASTPDFFNILTSCTAFTLALYAISQLVRQFTPLTGFNERQFIIFFLMTFVLITAPRLVYRFLREGPGWAILERGRAKSGSRRALFVGNLDEANIIISLSRSTAVHPLEIAGIIAHDGAASIGSRIQSVPVIGDHEQAQKLLIDYLKDTEGLDLVIFGQGAEKSFPDFAELVRIARQHGVSVEQFSGLSQLRRSGQLILEKVEMETILRRSTVTADTERLASIVAGKKVLVTGGAGSIGRTLVKRALDLEASAVLVADSSEYNIFQLKTEREAEFESGRLLFRVLDIGDKAQLATVVGGFEPDIIFHAAALKHVPLLEENWESAVKTNVFGTLTCAEVAAECGVANFVLVSSDKAADPTSVLGLTKRAAEQIVNAMHFEPPRAPRNGRQCNFTVVRFGNVFGSDGSVSTVFQQQIAAGGPLTITDPEMTRYFMTIGEAVDLVIMAAAVSAAHAENNGHGIYMLDMGEPVSIMAVADTMIRLAGKKPHEDIEIVVKGKRPGEKLHEVLSAPGEEVIDIGVPSIFGLKTGVFRWKEIETDLDALGKAVRKNDREGAMRLMRELFRPTDWVDPGSPQGGAPAVPNDSALEAHESNGEPAGAVGSRSDGERRAPARTFVPALHQQPGEAAARTKVGQFAG